jgi:hypothetical protein
VLSSSTLDNHNFWSARHWSIVGACFISCAPASDANNKTIVAIAYFIVFLPSLPLRLLCQPSFDCLLCDCRPLCRGECFVAGLIALLPQLSLLENPQISRYLPKHHPSELGKLHNLLDEFERVCSIEVSDRQVGPFLVDEL